MKKYILSIDAGTTGITVLLFDKNLNIVKKEYAELKQYYPKPGWVEHDPEELIIKINQLIEKIKYNIPKNSIISTGITNQRESVVLWNKLTGKPIYNIIVWQCRRTEKFCKRINKKYQKTVFNKTGLYIDSYFSATKIKWIIDNCKNTKKLIKEDKILCGTIDTWIVWNLTNRKNHITDFTNASRTMLFNINKKIWDNNLLEIFNIPKSILPEVKNSSDDFGIIDNTDIKINSIAGDQQSALYGHGAFKINSSKCTYGTGLFFLLNSGKKRIDSKNGLLTTLACDKNGKPIYAIEGSIFIGGSLIQWLRDNLGIINKASETEKIAFSTKHTNNVYVVPAFAGLGAPYWKSDCSGIISGLTGAATKSHIVRASLEAICYQVNDLLDCIEKDTNKKIKILNVDGGATNNKFLMQFQSDISNVIISKPKNIEITALGVAIMAGLKVKLWKNTDEVFKRSKIDKIYSPKMNSTTKEKKLSGWRKALKQL